MVIKSNLAKGWFGFQLLIEKLASVLCCRNSLHIIALFVIGCSILSVIIPPFQSPDEHDHIKRAYLLSTGVLVLERPEGQSSGGYVDGGLLKFMESYGIVSGKLSAEEVSSNGAIEWSGNRVYSSAPGTGYYFPAIYLPQAFGLWVGDLLDLTIDHSYRLARAYALCAVALLLYAAFRLYPPNPLVLALLAVPMTLFQFSSASLDGVSTALAVFSISAFLKISTNRGGSSVWVQYAFALAIAVLASSRIHALPLLLLLAATFFYTKNSRSLFLFSAVGLFVFGWTLFALRITVDLRVPIGESTSNIVVYYLLNPSQFFNVISQTLADDALREFYWKSFSGILGWLDTSFPDWYYTQFSLILSIIVVLTISFNNFRNEWSQRLLLLFVSVTSTLFIFFALLVTWSPHPAQLISGVQGRYFLIPSIILAYGIAGNLGLADGFRRNVATFISFSFFVFSLLVSVNLLINRYYLVENKVESEAIVIGDTELDNQPKMIASAALSQSSPIALKFPVLDENSLGKITRIGIMFGTHVRKNPGEAELLLTAKGEVVYRHIFPLPDLVDNAYEYFRVPADHYTSAELRFISGGGVSVWEIQAGDNSFLSCLKLNTIRNQTVTVNGCP